MRNVVALLLLLSLTGCSVLEADVDRFERQNKQWDIPTVSTTADVRLMTQHHNPMLNTHVVCTEPTPDVAKALPTALNVTASVNQSQMTGSMGECAEAIAELATASSPNVGGMGSGGGGTTDKKGVPASGSGAGAGGLG